MSKTKVYTRTGDAGSSQLLSVGRVTKDHPRLTAYGEIDELNSIIGLAQAFEPTPPVPQQLAHIQNQMFVLGSQIAVPEPDAINMPIPQIEPADTEKLEHWIDALDADLPPLKNFILPGGSQAAAHLHLARSVCRRCERQLQALKAAESVPAPAATYLNRLSDYLFVAARYENKERGIQDPAWAPEKR